MKQIDWKRTKGPHGLVYIGTVDGVEVARVEKVSTVFLLTLDGSFHINLSDAQAAALRLVRG